MAGNKTGGQKTKATNLKSNPNYYKEIGRLGGKAPYTGKKGFAANLELARIAGAIGGATSRRRKATK